MKTVIIGNGKAGSGLASMLSNEGHDVTVIDINGTALEKTQNTEDVMCIEGNGIDAVSYTHLTLPTIGGWG